MYISWDFERPGEMMGYQGERVVGPIEYYYVEIGSENIIKFRAGGRTQISALKRLIIDIESSQSSFKNLLKECKAIAMQEYKAITEGNGDE